MAEDSMKAIDQLVSGYLAGHKLDAGAGWEFCRSSEAVEWYDFTAQRWKTLRMAGTILGDCQVFRKPALSSSGEVMLANCYDT